MMSLSKCIFLSSPSLICSANAPRVVARNFGVCHAMFSTKAAPGDNDLKSDSIERELYLDQRVVRLVLNAEKKRNVLSLNVMDTLCKELREINDIQKIRAVILAAKGPAFSAGHNLEELTGKTGVAHHKLVFKRATELMTLIQSMNLPIIAEINGVAAAAGCQLVSSCDIIVASPKAKFLVNGLNIGLFCSTPSIPLSRNIPRKIAMDLLLTGRAMDAEEALRAGLVSRLVKSEADVKEEALNVCEQICRVSRSVVALGKAFFYAQAEIGDQHRAYRQAEVVMCENLKMADTQNGIKAFLGKTTPEWTHTNKKGDPDVMVGMLPNDKFSPASLSSTPTCSASTVSTTSLISMIATSASETVDQLSISTQSAKAASTSINDIMPSTSANVDNDSRTKQQEDTDNSEKLALIVCARCEQPIRDKYVYRVLEQNYHQNCLRCVDCQASFSNTCFSRHGNIYCRKHFLRRYGPKCSGCFEIINEQSTVRRANNHIYHVECFQCLICKKQFSTGDQFYLIPVDGRLVCRNDFENFASKENEMDCGNKRPRTTISAKSLEILKHAYQNSSKPPRHIREQLASQTGLDMRVVQVWFQNRRAKEKRLKKDAGRRWTSNNIANCINEDGVNIGMANDSLFGDGHEVNIRGLDSDSASNDGSLAGRSPLYGAGGYMDTSSDLDIRSELSYGDSTSSGAVVINGCMPNNDSMLATAASTSMNSSLIHGIPMHGQLTNGGSLNTSLYVDVHSISAAGSNPSAVTPICLADQEETSSVATTVIAPYLLNNNSATSLLSNNLLHDVHLQHQQQKQSPISHQHHQPLQDHQQQFAAAAAAVAAAAAAAHQRHEQHQLEQLHQLQQQHHHQLLVMQHRQHYMDQQSGVLHSHHALSPFSGHHAIQVSAPLPATDSLLAYTQQ